MIAAKGWSNLSVICERKFVFDYDGGLSLAITTWERRERERERMKCRYVSIYLLKCSLMNGLLLTILITTNKQRVSKFLARLSLSLLLLSSLCFSLSLLFVILLNRYTLVFGNHKLTSLQRYRYWGLYVKHISLCLSTVSLLGDALLSVSVNFYLSICLMMPTVPGLSLSLSLSFFFFFCCCCCVIVRQLRCEKLMKETERADISIDAKLSGVRWR